MHMIYRSSDDSCLIIIFHKWCHSCALMHEKYVWETEGCCFFVNFCGRGQVGDGGGLRENVCLKSKGWFTL